ncbi:Gfo/Idh/MocA family protein [Nakamurella deserti]|uniref:Gfo/Idh/MocA family protein n=1 Tax=Nakamurella deserti TaxID=2164074 RepID=UPI000DBE7A27|nr:Gfo/Idh/MocA family oxidoreductase [Nakamurella deserti]
MSGPVTLGVVGTGWRAEFFLRIAAALPDLRTVGIAARRPDAATAATARWGVPAHLSPAALVRHERPALVVVCVGKSENAAVVEDLALSGVKVLCETPPAPDLHGLRALWSAVGATRGVQVAEQYLMMPGHAARRELVRRGTIGEPTSVQVSSTHDYHAVAMMRGFLGVGTGPTEVRGVRFTAPLVDPLNRAGWTDDPRPRPAGTTLATVDFGDGRSGLYDFTDNQWHNRLRLRRVVVRGSAGELADDTVVRLAAPRTVLHSSISRSQLGQDLNLDGHDTEHLSFDGQVLWRNPFLGQRWMDEEIAIATVLRDSARWAVGDGPGPYSLAEACQDQLVALAVDEAVRTGRPVRTGTEAWAAR